MTIRAMTLFAETKQENIDKRGALVYNGHDSVCRKRAQRILEEHKLPMGMFFLEDVLEFGYNKSTGFMWLIQRNKTQHYFEDIDEVVSYGTEVSAFVEEGRMTNIRGIKARELVLWFPINDVNVAEEKLYVRSFANITKAFPISAFQKAGRSGINLGNEKIPGLRT